MQDPACHTVTCPQPHRGALARCTSPKWERRLTPTSALEKRGENIPFSTSFSHLSLLAKLVGWHDREGGEQSLWEKGGSTQGPGGSRRWPPRRARPAGLLRPQPTPSPAPRPPGSQPGRG